MNIQVVTSQDAAKELDGLLWRILWKPIGLPRDVRQQFRVAGEQLELVARARGQIIGGLVVVWTGKDEVELCHLAVSPNDQNQGIGRRLVTALIEMVAIRGCRRIHTIARNTSSGFFQRLGFRKAPGAAPEHPVFKKHGILFELMERDVEPAGACDALPAHDAGRWASAMERGNE